MLLSFPFPTITASATHLHLLTFIPRVPLAPRRDTSLSGRSIPHHTTTYTTHTSHHTSSISTNQALTPQVLHEHEREQNSLHENSTYPHTVDTSLDAGFDSLGVDMPYSVHSRVLQDPVGMAPLEHFEVDSAYPYQQYNSYQPAAPQQTHSYHDTQYANVASQSEAQYHQDASSSIHAAAAFPASGFDSQYVVYYAPQQEYYIPTTTQGEATGPGNDLAAVGTQFDSYVPSGYAQGF